MRSSGQIWIGDLIRAWTLIGATNLDERRTIARLLGFDVNEAEEQPEELVPDRISPDSLQLRTDDDSDGGTNQPKYDSVTEIGDAVRLSPLEMNQTQASDWLENRPTLPLPAEAEQPHTPLGISPLFKPEWLRGIVREALATRLPSDEVDLDNLMARLAEAELVEKLPTLRTKSLRMGVQILIDRSEGMLPYRDDQLWLAKRIRQVLGPDPVRIFNFSGSPLRGVSDGKRYPWSAYRPPPAGVPVLMLSDLGIALTRNLNERTTEDEWLNFADIVAQAGCPLVAFVPYPADRWPARLRECLPVVHWDRGTTALQVAARRSRLDRRAL